MREKSRVGIKKKKGRLGMGGDRTTCSSCGKLAMYQKH